MPSALKIIPLGGMMVTKNMFVYETEREILLVDCGIGFPDETMLGVDLLIPDTRYLRETNKPIVGMLLTHGHDDHIAALPYILPHLPEFPIFASPLTAAFAVERMEEFGIKRKIAIFDDSRGVRLGGFSVESIKVTHSVPAARHFVVSTGALRVYHGSDFKFDLTPVDNIRPEFQKMAHVGRQGVNVLLSDCLRSEKPGFSLSETSLSESFESEMNTTRGKVIVTVMSSNVHRVQQAVDVAVKAKRRVALFGRSVEANVRIAMELGLLRIPEHALLRKKNIKNLRDNELCLIVAGSQGQEGSALVRVAQGEHQEIEIRSGDKVIFSADPIPGNERAIYETIDALAHLGAEVAYHDVNDALHVSGHASSGDLMLLMELVKPQYLVPIGGTYRHMVQYRKLCENLSYPADRVFLLEEGQTVEIDAQGAARVGEKVKLANVMVDGLGIGDVGKVVLRDRQLMAEEGMLVVIVPLDEQTGELTGAIEIVSRGVVFMREAQAIIAKVKQEVGKVIKSFRFPAEDTRLLQDRIKLTVEKLLTTELERFPLIIPIIIRM